MGWWDDNAARITGAGALTLGQATDDGKGDATYAYAKGDAFYTIPLASCLTAPATTGTYIVPTSNARAQNATAGSKGHSILLNGANAINTVLVPITQVLRTAGGTSPNVGKGFLLKSLTIAWSPVTTALNTGLTVVAWTRALAESVAEDGTAYGGTVTYQDPVGTAVSNLPTAANATGNWLSAAVFPSPSWISVYDTDLFAELILGLNTPTCTAKIVKIGVRGAWAML